MRLLEFFNEAQEVELRSPGTLQKVLDAFLSFTAKHDELGPELQAAEARCAVLRSRLDQSKETGLGKHGMSSGQYGKLALDAEDMRSVAVALKTVGEPEDAQKLKDDLQGMRMEEISSSGFEGLGGHGEGFEVQNQGVTRRSPGEGPKVNGGRMQPQQFDSYDQPQFKNEEMPAEEMDDFIDTMGGLDDIPAPPMKPVFDPTRTSGTSGYDFTQDHEKIAQGVNMANKKMGIKEFMGVRDAESFDSQDPHQGTQEAGPIAQHESVGGMRAAVDRMSKRVDPTGMKDIQHRMSKLKKSSEKEKQEHPWASKKQATQIAQDHMKLGEGVYRLTEFYVISPEGNGVGNVKKDDEPEPIAAGGADELSAVVVQNEPEVPDLHNAISQAFDQAVKDGSEVVFDPDEMTIRLVKKDDKEED